MGYSDNNKMKITSEGIGLGIGGGGGWNSEILFREV